MEHLQQQIVDLHLSGFSNRQISIQVGISPQKVSSFLKERGYSSSKNIPLFTKEELLKHWKSGLNDYEISKILNVSRSLVQLKRKIWGLSSNYSSEQRKTIDEVILTTLVEEGLSDREISERMKCAEISVYFVRKRLSLRQNENRSEAKKVVLSQVQKECLFGTLLGDGSLRLSKRSKNPRGKVEHCAKQLEYLKYKHQFLENISSKIDSHVRNLSGDRSKHFGKKGLSYSYSFQLNANPELHEFYYEFYSKGKKIIPIDLLDKYYSPLAMAIHFMDDGTKTASGYSIATMCFERENQQEFSDFIYKKYGIKSHITSKNQIYLLAETAPVFTKLIKPFVPPVMQYKLHDHVSKVKRKVNMYNKTGDLIKTFASVTECKKYLNIGIDTVIKQCKGNVSNPRHGYILKYTDG